MPNSTSATPEPMNASSTSSGSMPAIHIIVVVVSPTTLPAPPALEAATIAARKPMCTLPLKTVCAIAPPIIAAAMLSRKLDSTNTSTSSTKQPFQSSGSQRGNTAGISVSSKCLASSAKPSNSSSRLVRITHSCNRCRPKPPKPAPVLKGENTIL